MIYFLEGEKIEKNFQMENHMNIFRIVLLFLFLSFFLCSSAFSAELYGQVIYKDGRPAGYVEILINDEVKSRTDNSGFYSVDLDKGVYNVSVQGISKRIFLPRKGARVDFRINRSLPGD